MKGCRPLDTNEILKISEQFDGTYEIRNRSLFMLGVSVGGRISELLSLRIDDVWQNGQPISDLLFQKRVVKGKETARMIPVNADGRQAITELIQWHVKLYGDLDPQRPLFTSRKFDKSISRVQAHRILEKAFQSAGLNGKLASHSMRKTYSQRMYDATGDIFMVKEALGHKSVETTRQYLGVSYKKLQTASRAIELSSNKRMVLLHSIDEIATGDLIAELMARSIDMTSAIQQMKAERKTSDKIIRYPVQAERLYGSG
ncbi:tyrosine-type recombinase/integrase [bacterium]|nr:tyrosine-type recombinase/integrase [bacterium]